VEVITRSLSQPALYSGSLVGGIVVKDEVYVKVRRHGRIDPVEETPELGGSVPPVAGADYLSGFDIEGRKERSCAVPAVIMSTALDLSGTHGKQRSCSF
jgi:hypothetical protein